MLSIMNLKDMQTKTMMKYDYITIRIVQIIIKSNSTEFSKDAGQLSLSQMECKMGQSQSG